MLPTAPANIIAIVNTKPNGYSLFFMSLMSKYTRNATATKRKPVRKSLLPSSIPNAIPLFSMKRIWHQSPKTEKPPPKGILVFTAIFINWSIKIASKTEHHIKQQRLLDSAIISKLSIFLCFNTEGCVWHGHQPLL